jgi:hypothetical protein
MTIALSLTAAVTTAPFVGEFVTHKPTALAHVCRHVRVLANARALSHAHAHTCTLIRADDDDDDDDDVDDGLRCCGCSVSQPIARVSASSANCSIQIRVDKCSGDGTAQGGVVSGAFKAWTGDCIGNDSNG